MRKSIEKHLEGITVENLMNYKKEAFSMYASARGVQLGFDANGYFVVKTKDKVHTFDEPEQAIEQYSNLIKQ
jgi:hypothetical protein